MTAIVGILNKKAAVMAADSIITRDEGFIWLKHHDWRAKENR